MSANKEQPGNVCIFGLSANPPTGLLGHQGIVKLLIGLEKFDEVKIRMLPKPTMLFEN